MVGAPVIRASSSWVVEKTAAGWPAAAQTTSYSRSWASSHVGTGAGCAMGETPPITWPVWRRTNSGLARLSAGRKLSSRSSGALGEARQALEAAACGSGYGRFVLGELAHRQGDGAAARGYLEEFVARADSGRVALRVGLSAELARARSLLSKLEVEESAKV